MNMDKRPSVEEQLDNISRVIRRDEAQAGKPEEDRLNEIMRREDEKQQQRADEDMRQALRLPYCRRILYKIVAECHVFASSFVGAKVTPSGAVIPTDTHMSAKLEGERAIGIFLIDLIERAEPGVTLQMQREYVSDKKSQADRLQKIVGGLDG